MARNDLFPKILVLEEKHGDRHFIVHSKEELALAAARIVRERYADGLYDFSEDLRLDEEENERLQREFEEFRTENAAFLNLTEEEIDALPDALKEKAESVVKQHFTLSMAAVEYNTELQSDVEYLTVSAAARLAEEDTAEEAAAVEDRPGRSLAFTVLNNRKDYEYEGFRIEYPASP